MRRASSQIPATHPLGAYAKNEGKNPGDGNDVELVIPEEFNDFSDEALTALHDQAVETFQGLYGDGSDLTDEDVTALSSLTEGIEAVKAEMGVRDEAKSERAERARELASRVTPPAAEGAGDAESSEEAQDGSELSSKGDKSEEDDEDADGDPADAETDEEDKPEGQTDDEDAAETVTASSGTSRQSMAPTPRKRTEVKIDGSRMRRHLPKNDGGTDGAPKGMRDITLAAGEGSGFSAGQGIDWTEAGEIIDRRLAGFNKTQYASAARMGRHMRQQMGVMSIRKPLDDDLIISSSDPIHTEDVLRRATSESRLPGNSLVASGGWCAPSEVVYDLLELESRDGIFSLPEVGISRGGITRTLGPDFAQIYEQITGFHYTEQEDIDGDYDGAGGGSKPCYKVECPEFDEFRLEVDGLCITAGLLMQRGYPEVIARTLRGALIAHDHRLAGRILREVQAGSTAIDIGGASSEGTVAPLLSAIELQVEHLRYQSRISRSATMEGVFPFWIRGAIRSDVSKRTGQSIFDVTDAQISAWFTSRGISPQFVYNWQDLNQVDAAAMVGWPTSVTFLLYPSGTWVRGTSDIITVDTLFDSTQLGTNDYTALFTEEGYLVLPMGHHSRAITVDICADGATAAAINFECGGVDLPIEVGGTEPDPEPDA